MRLVDIDELAVNLLVGLILFLRLVETVSGVVAYFDARSHRQNEPVEAEKTNCRGLSTSLPSIDRPLGSALPAVSPSRISDEKA